MVHSKLAILLFMSALILPLHSFAQIESDESIELIDGLSLTKENPLTPYAQKKNGKYKNRLKVPFSAMARYYQYAGQGFILENTKPEPLFNLDMDVLHSKTSDDIEFLVNIKKKKAYPAEVINPHSVSNLFILDPIAYIKMASAPDFLTAKQKVYGVKKFDVKNVKYDYNMVHLEDWRSLNHPPVRDLGEDLTVWDKALTPIDYSTSDSPYYSVDFQKNLDKISNTELSFGNKLELLENGLSFERKLVEVAKAEKHILMAVMSFFCDASSRKLEDSLIAKAKEGLDVKLIVEKVWTLAIMKKCLRRMRDGGIDVVLADDLLKKGEEQALFHDKFMVIDGKILIIGGANIMASDNISTGMNHMNRDNDVIAVGPAASDAILGFTDLWRRYAGKRNIKNLQNSRVKDISFYESLAIEQKKAEAASQERGQNLYDHKLSHKSERSRGVCRFMNQSPYTDKHLLSKVFIEYIDKAQTRMSMTNGNTFYFDLPEHDEKERARDTWNKRLYRSIFAKAEQGVQLDIVGNGIDGGFGEASNMFKRLKLKKRFKKNPLPRTIYSYLADFMDKTAAKANQPFLEVLAKKEHVRAWTHFQYMHSKKMQFDRVVSVVSSYNLDEWSADKSHESALVCMDDELNQQMEKSFLKDVVNSQPAAITN